MGSLQKHPKSSSEMHHGLWHCWKADCPRLSPLKKKRSWNPKQTVLYTEVLVKEPFPKYFLLQIIQLKLEATIYQWIFQVPGIHDTFLASTLAYLATVGLCASCRKNWTSWSIRHGMRSFSWWNRWNDDVFKSFYWYFFPNQIKIITNTNHFGQNRPQIHLKTPFRNYPWLFE